MGSLVLLLAVGAFFLTTGRSFGKIGAPQLTAADAAAGKVLYEKKCAQCHGEKGDGKGPAAKFMLPDPRDFTSGQFKVRTTKSGEPPTDEDLFRAITLGLPGTTMPAWDDLSEKERWQLVAYLKTFSDAFSGEKKPEVVELGNPPKAAPELVEEGKKLYEKVKCLQCHGKEGRGDGPSAPELTEEDGERIWPADLTMPWDFRGGSDVADIFRTISTGFNGTPMPTFEGMLVTEEDEKDEAARKKKDVEARWALAHYVKSLGGHRRLDQVAKGTRVEGELPSTAGDPKWVQAVAVDFPMVGQIIQDPRQFAPTVNNMNVRVLYNDKEVAFLLTWHDHTKSEPGEEEDRKIYADGVAMQFPVAPPDGPEKPYFLMGNDQLPVDLWRWTSSPEKLVEEVGYGMDKLEAKPAGSVNARAEYHEGEWRLVLRRSLATANPKVDAQFAPGKFLPVAFFAWDGHNGDTGKKCAVTTWYWLLLDPPKPAGRFIFPPVGMLLAAAFQFWLARRLKGVSL